MYLYSSILCAVASIGIIENIPHNRSPVIILYYSYSITIGTGESIDIILPVDIY